MKVEINEVNDEVTITCTLKQAQILVALSGYVVGGHDLVSFYEEDDSSPLSFENCIELIQPSIDDVIVCDGAMLEVMPSFRVVG